MNSSAENWWSERWERSRVSLPGKSMHRIEDFCRSQRLGWVFPEGTSFQCFPDDRGQGASGGCFVHSVWASAQGTAAGGPHPDAPDLAVEVVSPNDLAYDVDSKVEDYLQAGVRLVWVVNPVTRTVRVHHPDGPGATLRADGELTGGDVLPGFHCPIRDLFLLPQPAA